MILTVCVRPRIEVNLEVDCLSTGHAHEIINKTTFYTGRAINVATGLARLGANSFATGFMYEDNGRLFELALHKEGVPYKFVWMEGRVKERYKFIDRKSMLTEFYEESLPVPEKKQEELINLIKDLSKTCSCIVLSGSPAKGMQDDYNAKLLKVIPSGLKKIIDTEGKNLLNTLGFGVDLVKPNLEEIKRTLKISINCKNDALKACYKLLDLGAERVLLSLGKYGAIITDGSKNYYCKSINVAMNSTVGAGDGMLAGATNALINGDSLKEILRAGVAAGSATITTPESISFYKSKFEEILSGLTVQEL
ncbi:MAG: hypothetical protein E7370_01625 [Clostridiales bacterium]|nr:hypothetical protein [Clostridiales bacterium]